MAALATLAVIAALAGPAPDPAPGDGDATVHLGAGWAASQALDLGAAQATPPSPATVQWSPPPPVLPRAGIRPASTLDLVKHTRRAQIMAVGTAVAVQGAMIVYGIMRMFEQEREADARRAAEPEPFNPHPR